MFRMRIGRPWWLSRRPRAGNCFYFRGMASALVPLVNSIRPKRGIWIDGQYRPYLSVEGEQLHYAETDPGYDVVHVAHYMVSEPIGAAVRVQPGVFVLPRDGVSKIRFASDTGGYESSIEMGFVIFSSNSGPQAAWLTDNDVFEVLKTRSRVVSAAA